MGHSVRGREFEPWDQAEAVRFCASLNAALVPVGYYVGMTGSVLFLGSSDNDLDVIVYPTSTARQDEVALRSALAEFGLVLVVDREKVTRAWRRNKSLDEKWVEVYEYRRDVADGIRRVDVFFMS